MPEPAYWNDAYDPVVLRRKLEELKSRIANVVTTGALDLVMLGVNANVVVTSTTKNVYVGMSGLTAQRSVTLPNPAGTGQTVKVVDEDGSLAAQSILVLGNGKTIRGMASVLMNAASPGAFGWFVNEHNGSIWSFTP